MEIHQPSSGSGGGVESLNGLTGDVTLSAGTNITLTPVGNDIEISSSGGGTPGGSNTQLQYNNAGAFGGITGATTNGTVVTLTSPIIATSLTASYATASTIAIFDGSKNLISADTATYPSLTELSYVKGVTSAIQTQIDGKVTTARTITIAGTTNQITSSAGAQDLSANRTWTLSIPNDLRLTSASVGTNADSVPTLSSTSTLTNKTLTNPVITIPDITYTVEPSVDDTAFGDKLAGVLAGDTIAQWDLVYLDSTSGRWELADADAATTSGGVLLGLAMTASTDGNALTVLLRGIVRNDGWTWTGAGKKLYPSTTAAGMTETQPSGTDDVVRPIADTLSDDCIWFAPGQSYITHT